jgi:DNA mismatch repair ATPase MutS
MIRLEKWKSGMESTVRKWFDALAEAEVLNSMACFAFANPEYILPETTGADFHYEARELGHPLILAQKRVSNSFFVEGRGKTVVVTGSNMSGKSTFLRTLGINAVLALAGAPVCAASCRISVFQVFTAMRTQDSLEESVSSFYAELKRLRQLIDLLPEGQPVFYLLDEILKGTNSNDRHEGAKALIRQLHKHNATGLVSTHDLALGQMGEISPEYVTNYSFNSEFADGKLYFDYKLREGICQSFNASQLMRQMGIEV